MYASLDRDVRYIKKHKIWTDPIRVGKCPPVDAVVRGVEAAFGEPRDVARGESATAHGLKGAVPVQRLVRFLHHIGRISYSH